MAGKKRKKPAKKAKASKKKAKSKGKAKASEPKPAKKDAKPPGRREKKQTPAKSDTLEKASATAKAENVARRKAEAKPRPMPKPKPKAKKSLESPGCVWTRLRAGTGQLTTRASLSDGTRLKIRIFEGLRYAMPPGLAIGNPTKPHPAVVVEQRQMDYPPIDLEEVNVERWNEQRTELAHFVGRAQVVIENHNGKIEWTRLRKKGVGAVVARYNELSKALGHAKVEGFELNPKLPEGVIPILDDDGKPLDKDAVVTLDRKACAACGKAFAKEGELRKHSATGHKPAPVPEWLQELLGKQLEDVALSF